jgi:hypothetical protein
VTHGTTGNFHSAGAESYITDKLPVLNEGKIHHAGIKSGRV